MAFLLTQWKLILIGILVAGMLASFAYIRLLQERNQVMQQKLEIAETSIKSLRFSIDEQNRAVEKLKAEADERMSRYLKEIAAAKTASNAYKKQAADILRRTAAQNVSKCDAANQLINEEIAFAK